MVLTVRCFRPTISDLLCLRTGRSFTVISYNERNFFITSLMNSESAEIHVGFPSRFIQITFSKKPCFHGNADLQWQSPSMQSQRRLHEARTIYYFV